MGTGAKLTTVAHRGLLRRLRLADSRIWLASPYLSMKAAKKVAQAATASPAGDRRILTALDERCVRAGTLSPQGLLKLMAGGFEVASLSTLHAKVSLVDSQWALVGSGNLTGAGLGLEGEGNLELGVELDPLGAIATADVYTRWWEEAKPIGEARLEELATLPVERSHGKGSAYGGILRPSGAEQLEAILAEEDPLSRRYWIKANYHRHDLEDWWNRNWISDRRRASYAVKDLIFLYLSARDGGPACCPAIVRSTSKARHDPDWVLEKGDAEAIPQWPYVTETICIAEVPATEGIDLEVMGKTPQSLQNGYCEISRRQFENGGEALLRQIRK